MTHTDEPIQPIYETPVHYGEIDLVKKVDAELKQGEKKFSGKLKIHQEWPEAELIWEFTDSDDLSDVQFGNVSIECKNDHPCTIMGRVYSKGKYLLRGLVDKPAINGTDHKLEWVIFHLAEYPRLEVDYSNGKYPPLIKAFSSVHADAEDLHLECDEWSINIRFSADLDEFQNRKHPMLSGVGKILKKDRSEFKKDLASPVLAALDAFLSFSFAGHMPPMLAVGGNSTCDKSCLFLNSHYLENNYLLRGWIDGNKGKSLSNAFPGFMRLWHQKEWQEPIKTSVDYLIEATQHSGGTKGAIAMAQIPLEMLASMVFSDSQTVINEDEFQKLSAASRLQLLLHHCGIPLEVPDGLALMSEIDSKGDSKHDTGPKIVTEVRNSVIHPTKKNRGKMIKLLSGCRTCSDITSPTNSIPDKHEIYEETLQLFRWYITLILLRLFDYHGEYGNRLVTKNNAIYEPVPWAK